jgi:hypothetical protein
VLWTACRDVTRVSYNVASGEPPPRRLQVEGRLVRLGGFRGQDPLLLTLFDQSGREHIDVLVIPPETAADYAQRALDLAGGVGSIERPGRILELAAVPSRTRVPPIRSIGTNGGRLGDRRRTYTDRFPMTGPAGGHPLSRIARHGSTQRCGQRP